MDTFNSLYLEYCKKYSADAQEAVKAEIKRISLSNDETSRVFNLSSHHLTDKTCMILAKILAFDQKFNSLQLNDCALSSAGLKEICHGLQTNTSIVNLELKGNNIIGDTVEGLAKLLRQNKQIKSLSLEWNSLGMSQLDNFGESLGQNKSIRDLDLRNNQITHVGAIQICAAIEANTSLKTLDLRWNNFGLIGGKNLMHALKKNHYLVILQIAGNNIPEELVEGIEAKVSLNQQQSKTAKEYSDRTKILTNELQNFEFEKDKQVNLLLSKIDLQEESTRKVNRALNEKMKKLQNALDDRLSTVSSLTSKLSIIEADLALSDQKCKDLEHFVKKCQLDHENEIRIMNARSKTEKEDLVTKKSLLERDLSEYEARYTKLEEKFRELEQKNRELLQISYDAKERLAQGTAELQIKSTQLDEETRRFKQKQRDEIKELEATKAREILNLRDEAENAEKHLKDRISKLENANRSLESEVSRLKSTIASKQTSFDNELQEYKLKAQQEEAHRRKELEDRNRMLHASNNDFKVESEKLNAKIAEQQNKLAAVTLENESLKRNNEIFKIQLSEKDSECQNSIERAKTDFEKKLSRVQKDIDRLEEYKAKVTDFEIKIKNLESEKEISVKRYQLEEEKCKVQVQRLEALIESYRDEDATRSMKIQQVLKDIIKPSQVLAKH